MDYVLITFGVIFIISGILGCVLPIIPGPPLSYIGLLLLHFTEKYQFSSNFLIIFAEDVVKDIRVSCNTENITVDFQTTEDRFNGLIYPKGLSKNSTCMAEYIKHNRYYSCIFTFLLKILCENKNH